MTRARLQAHPTCDPNEVDWGAWWAEVDGRRTFVDLRLDGWDYATSLRIGATFHADESVIPSRDEESTRRLAWVIEVNCPKTHRRWVESAPLRPNEWTDLALDVPVGEAAGRLELQAHLVELQSGDAGRANRVAASDRRTVHIEGSSGRFPTDVISFADLGRPPAPWALAVEFDTLDDAFMGGVRLLVNQDHEWGRSVTDPDVDSRPLTAMMRRDVVLNLVLEIVASETPTDAEVWEDESVGAVADAVCQLHLDRSLRAVTEMARTTPSAFVELLDSRVLAAGRVS